MLRLLLAAAVLALASCAHAPTDAGNATRWQHARQMVVVTTGGWDDVHGQLRTFERDEDGAWREAAGPRPVVIGRTGAAWGIGLHDIPVGDPGPVKREGDGRSPAGVFAIGEAFGYAATATTALPYAAMDASDYCIDVSGSPLYNRIVDADEVGTDAVEDSTEPMRRDLHADGDQRYRLGFVIEHNPRGKAMAGSCIFAHLWKSPDSTTAGCTAMQPETMQALLAWLDPKQQPVFVLLPQAEYRRLQHAWQLPALEPQA
jgi:L,D-peptidoglycan transpeptidase YkuD (ErfK/YbiS/YcfS/YnhG family)